MSEQADLDELARRYLDLWQDQMTALAGDKDFAQALQTLMGTMGLAATGAAAPWAAWPAMMAGLQPAAASIRPADGKDHGVSRNTAGRGGAAASAGAEAAAGASHGGGAGLDELARRLAALEERVAALEAGRRGGRGGASAKPRKRRS